MSIFEYDREWEEELLRKEEFDSEKLRADHAERELLLLKEKLALMENK